MTTPSPNRHDSILSTIGDTPVVRIQRLAPAGRNLWVKVEAANPLGSVKDRLALGVIEDAERRGLLQPGQTVVEATSGNTGIGLAMVCAAKGYPLVIVMAENFSLERRKILRFLGAKLVLTPAPSRGTGMVEKARELAEAHDWFLCRQFENEANADVHSRTTAREILTDFEDERLDAWVTGFGTGGTLKGVARVLKDERPTTRVVVCEPRNSPVLASGVRQQRNPDGSPASSHPRFQTHPVQGWAPDFVPKLTEDVVDHDWIDEIVPVEGSDAIQMSRELARKEGIFTGISGGATFAGAVDVCARMPEGSNVLCMLPDTGERYLSTPLFEDIPIDMTDEEIELSRSTPNHRFDVPSTPPVTPAAQPTGAPAADATAFVEDAISDRDQPVVMFALQWCEFCWSIRKLFREAGIRYRSIDLDGAEFSANDRGNRIREALREKVSSPTVPQIFVGGQLVGGCTETIESFTSGKLHELLSEAGVEFDKDSTLDASACLPRWLQPR